MGARPAAAAALTPKEVFGILRRHIVLMVSLTILGFVVGGVAWYLLLRYVPKYRAEAYIQVLSPAEKDPMTFVSPLVQKDIQYGYRTSIAALLTQQSTLQRLIDLDAIQRTKWFGRFGDIASEKHKCITRAFEDLKKNLTAYPQRDGEFVTVSMTCGDAQEAADIVNEMVKLFVRWRGTASRSDISARLLQYDQQKVNLQRDLDAAEKSLEDVRTTYGISDLEISGERRFQHTITVRLNALELELNDRRLEVGQIESIIKEFEQLATGPVTEQISRQVEADPVVITLRQRLALQESALAGVLAKFGENHRVVLQVREVIDGIKEEIRLREAYVGELIRQSNVKNAQDQLVVLRQRLEELQKLRDEAAKEQKQLDLARVQYEQRAAIRDNKREMLDSVKETIDKLRIVYDDPETPKVRPVGEAPKPLEVSSPRWELYFPGGTVLGLLVGVGLAFLIELLNDLVRTPRDVSRYLHIPLLGVIPDAIEDSAVSEVEDLCHVVRQAPYSVIGESYRRLRTNLSLSGSANALKVLLVSSGMPGDGRTSVAVNLATAFVADNKKVLLIDASFRRPSLQSVFPSSGADGIAAGDSEFGLSSLLIGLCGYEEARRCDVLEGLDVIYSGRIPSNPTELLGSYRMEQLLKDCRKSYDYVIIDSAPILLVSDAKVLAKIVDGTLLVFNAAYTRRGAAQRTILELKQVSAPISGCVLFAVRTMKGGYFREQFKSYRRYQEMQPAPSV
ncbi:MAG TPA: polysaccharide biosynthesis tyrosine autokinase [Sedimentisphaerales bacterium]|nr:polysaccharide biosynthesis tyrosine autokinase [Sedimentisphaerales bacterium]